MSRACKLPTRFVFVHQNPRVNCVDGSGMSPLMIAANEANVDLADSQGETALTPAEKGGSDRVIQALRESLDAARTA